MSFMTSSRGKFRELSSESSSDSDSSDVAIIPSKKQQKRDKIVPKPNRKEQRQRVKEEGKE